jgi:Domain of unknown function (DUF4145)
MAVIVADCPRCDANQMTMDVLNSVLVKLEHDWMPTFEAFCRCRNCDRTTVYFLTINSFDFAGGKYGRNPEQFPNSLNPMIEAPGRFVCIRDLGAQQPPEHVPKEVANAFNQGATSIAVECWDAAAAMFRKSIDLATRPMLPQTDVNGLNSKIRRDLGLRLPWLFDQGTLPKDLRELSTCVREDGNDGAHTGALTKEDAVDLLDFTTALLERIYTEPERLKIATTRRQERRKPKEV